MKLAVSELLPRLFDRIVSEFTRGGLRPAQREALVSSLVDGLTSAALASNRDQPAKADLSLLTADRFTTGPASRDQLVHQMAQRSQVSERLARVALLLMESRTDVLLTSSAEHRFGLNEVGDIGLASQWEALGWSLEELPRLLRPPGSMRRPLLDRWLRRPRPSTRALVEGLELAELLRPPMAYEVRFHSTWVPFEESDLAEWKEAPPLEEDGELVPSA